MGIKIRYEPEFGLVADVAQQTGYGMARQRQEDISRQESELAQKQAFDREMFEKEQEALIAQERRKYGMQAARDKSLYGYDLAKDRYGRGTDALKAEERARLAQQKDEADAKAEFDKGYSEGTRGYSKAGQAQISKLQQQLISLNNNQTLKPQDKEGLVQATQAEIDKIKYDQSGLYSEVIPKGSRMPTQEEMNKDSIALQQRADNTGSSITKKWEDGTTETFTPQWEKDIKQAEAETKLQKPEDDLYKQQQARVEKQLKENYTVSKAQKKSAESRVMALEKEKRAINDKISFIETSEDSEEKMGESDYQLIKAKYAQLTTQLTQERRNLERVAQMEELAYNKYFTQDNMVTDGGAQQYPDVIIDDPGTLPPRMANLTDQEIAKRYNF